MESVCCDLCGADTAIPLFERADRFSGALFGYVTCPECDLIYLNPRPSTSDLSMYYPNSYEAYRPLETLTAIMRWRRRHALSIMRRFVTCFQPPGRLLDIGCATGEFLQEMQRSGWEVEGVEISPQAAVIAQETRGLKVFVGPVAAFDAPKNTFDVVTLWDVLEHLPSPYVALRKIHGWLRNGGHVIFSIPNVQSFDARLFGHGWTGWDAPRHLYIFPEPTLNRLLTEAGFEIEEQRCLLGGPGAFLLSCQFMLDSRVRSVKTRGRILRALSLLLPFLLWPYKELSYALRRGPIITVVACKVTSGQ
jgi:2-polyprenyl-3-methyl-5-hydroxy-6-metoxy-1,4-benzoquinol methylase